MSSYTNEEAVVAIAEPEWTNTWHPISHKRCVSILNTTMETMNLPVVQKNYALTKNGANAFGSWVLGNEDVSQTLVWRNSLNKAFAFGIAAGTHAFVCSNLAFGGEFIEFRKHSKGMDDEELSRVVCHGMELILPRMQEFQKWHLGLHKIHFSDTKVKALAYEAIAEEVISKHQIDNFNSLLFGENPSYSRNELFGFHGACTETFKNINMLNSEGRQGGLCNFINTRFKTPVIIGN